MPGGGAPASTCSGAGCDLDGANVDVPEETSAEDGFGLMLWTWIAEIVIAPYSDGLDVAALIQCWHESS